MLFFKRILKEPEPTSSTPAVERRSTKRYAINPAFALKAVLSFIARDDTGAPLSNTRHGWNWKGRLIDCSEQGVRIQMGPGLKVELGDKNKKSNLSRQAAVVSPTNSRSQRD